MKSFVKIVLLVVAIIVVCSPITTAYAAPLSSPAAQEAVAVLPTLDEIVATMKNLGGFALFFAALFNAGKFAGWLQDDAAPKASLVFNSLTFIVLLVLQLSGRADLIPVIDKSAGIIAAIITSMFALYYQLWLTRKGHEDVLSGLPVIGFSYSAKKRQLEG
jgi:hypothetical protein